MKVEWRKCSEGEAILGRALSWGWACTGTGSWSKAGLSSPHSTAQQELGRGWLQWKWAQVPNVTTAHVLKASRTKALPQTFSPSQTSPMHPFLVFCLTQLVAANWCPSNGMMWYFKCSERKEGNTKAVPWASPKNPVGTKIFVKRKNSSNTGVTQLFN